MTLREEILEVFYANTTFGEKADAIVALTEADARERERKAFVEGVDWMVDPTGPEDVAAAEAEAARRYKP
jgi:hypothetical protein